MSVVVWSHSCSSGPIFGLDGRLCARLAVTRLSQLGLLTSSIPATCRVSQRNGCAETGFVCMSAQAPERYAPTKHCRKSPTKIALTAVCALRHKPSPVFDGGGRVVDPHEAAGVDSRPGRTPPVTAIKGLLREPWIQNFAGRHQKDCLRGEMASFRVLVIDLGGRRSMIRLLPARELFDAHSRRGGVSRTAARAPPRTITKD